MIKYIVKDLKNSTYFCGEAYGWRKSTRLADVFSTEEAAQNFAAGLHNGWYKIEKIYIVQPKSKLN